MQAILGLLAFTLIAWLLSENRKKFNLRLVIVCLITQLILAFLLLRVDFFIQGLSSLNNVTIALSKATIAGTSTIFGYLGGAPIPFEIKPGAIVQPILALQILPQILVLSVVFAVLWYLGILKKIIVGIAKLLQYSIGISGPLGLSATSSIFLGMVESPMLIKPYIRQLSHSDLFALLTCGMSTVAGTVMILYATVLQGIVENPLGHILVASVISVPAAIMIARLMIPPQDTGHDVGIEGSLQYRSLMDAVTRSGADGLKILLSVISMLVILIALVSLINQILSSIPWFDNLTLEDIFGWFYTPIAWLMGIPWEQSMVAGRLLGEKTILSELLAYLSMSNLEPGSLDEKSRIIMTYALSGFANFASLGIMLGGFSVLCPERQDEILNLAPRSLISGTLATCMTGAVVGLLLLIPS